MLKRFRIPLIALLLTLIVLPAAAAERVDDLPEIKEISSVRFEIADVLNGELFIAGKGEATAADRMHYVLKSIPFGNEPQEVLEVVVYDGKVYTRENNDTQWYLEDEGDVSSLTHNAMANEIPVSKIGSMSIAGVMTDQYQVWLAGDGGDIDHIALDFWIGQQMNYLYQEQISIIGNDPDLGELKLEEVTRYYDMDAANIYVGPPANAKPRSSTGLFNDSSKLHRVSNILGLGKVRELALKHAGR
jgi:hypothetical protein